MSTTVTISNHNPMTELKLKDSYIFNSKRGPTSTANSTSKSLLMVNGTLPSESKGSAN